MTQAYEVAPLAGAWIETQQQQQQHLGQIVAPLAGAWIETMAFVSLG